MYDKYFSKGHKYRDNFCPPLSSPMLDFNFFIAYGLGPRPLPHPYVYAIGLGPRPSYIFPLTKTAYEMGK